jgi:ketosteroid isomerase-like protein
VTHEERARAGYDAWSRRDWEGFAALLHPDVLYVTSHVFPGMDETYEGREAVVGFLREFSATWEEIVAEADEMRAAPDGVYALVHFSARARDGLRVDRDFGHHLVFEGDLLKRLVTYPSWDEGLAEVGLS